MLSSPFILTIFGATGDLAKNKLIPSLFALFKAGELPEEFFIVGFARRSFTDAEFADMFKDLILQKTPTDKVLWSVFTKHLYYQQGTFDYAAGYVQLIEKLKGFDDKLGACITRVFYLSTLPSNYEIILENMKSTKLSEGCGHEDN